MTLNDIVQWTCIIIIFIIILVKFIRKIARAIDRRRHGDAPFNCGCGCPGCPASRRHHSDHCPNSHHKYPPPT